MADRNKPSVTGKEHLSTPKKGRTATELLALFSPTASSPSSARSTIVVQHEATSTEPTHQTRASLPTALPAGCSRNSARTEVIALDSDTDNDSDPLARSSMPSSRSAPQTRLKPRLTSRQSSAKPPISVQPASEGRRFLLRDRASLTKPKRVSENEIQLSSKTSRPQRSTRTKDVIIQSDAGARPTPSRSVPVKRDTARNQIRDSIATVTQKKRDAFYVEKRDYFLPLLPAQNYITKLIENHDGKSQATATPTHTSVVPYHSLDDQPKGVTATMKPYQLGGLSFLVWLYQNGMSGILGDEMGLGKTLQTLSVFQYLKENDALDHAEPRPHLVVCPLSVLNSWISEARKWTPDLKIMKFHGPAEERNRLKTVARPERKRKPKAKKPKSKAKTRPAAKERRSIYVYSSSEASESESSEVEDESATSPYDVIVTTYDTFKAEAGWLKSAFAWRYVVLDEGHKIKGSETQLANVLQSIRAEFRLLLSGTPLQNNLRELWALLHWLYPEVFTEKTQELFMSSFDLSRGQVSVSVLDYARQLLELIMLRRTKSSPGINLGIPPKQEVLLYVPLTPAQRSWYTHLISNTGSAILEDVFRGSKDKEMAALSAQAEEDKLLSSVKVDESATPVPVDEWQQTRDIVTKAFTLQEEDKTVKSAYHRLMNLLMQLRKCCTHPYQLPHAAPEPYYFGEHIILASSKFIVLDKLVAELVMKQQRKILIFSQFTRVLDYCEDFLALRGFNAHASAYKYHRLDGGTASAARNLGIRMFNDPKSEYRIMLISTGAGGLGINLVAATDVIFLDEHWNPQVTLQAEARAHRIGQTKEVTTYKIVTQGTVEEQMLGRIRKKLYLSAKVTESMQDIHTSPDRSKTRSARNSMEDMPQLGSTQLKSLIRRGAQALSRPEIDVTEMLAWDWQTVLEKCKDKTADPTDEERLDAHDEGNDEQKWLSVMEKVETVVFDGQRLQRSRGKNPNEIVQNLVREDRRVGKNTTVMVDGFAINKESMMCGDWEAVPTMAGKDPRLAEPVREKKIKGENQEHCQVCWDGGELALCSGCPRSYHVNCLDKESRARAKSKSNFYCPQHQCVDCERKTGAAGGLIFRCRWCERGYCEECLEWDKATLIGSTLIEFEILSCPANDHAFFIECPSCTDHFAENPGARMFFEQEAVLYQQKYDGLLAKEQADQEHALEEKEKEQKAVAARIITQRPVSITSNSSSPEAPSLTEATTAESSGLATPQLSVKGDAAGRKRKNPFSIAAALTGLATPQLSVEDNMAGGKRKNPFTIAAVLAEQVKKVKYEC